VQAVALLAEVERSYIGLERIRAFARTLRTGQGGYLRVAGLPALAAGFLPRFVGAFSRAWPGLQIHVDGLPSDMIRTQVSTGQLDLGVVSYPFSNPGLVITPLEEGAVVALPPGHALASCPVLRTEHLADHSLILLTRFGIGLHPDHVALLALTGRSPIETPLATIACRLVLDGAGIGIVDRFSAMEFVGEGLVLRPFEPRMIFGSAVIHARDRALSPVAGLFRTAFLEHVQAFLRGEGGAV
jgi:DNA-binding transcriptional LysR family regulator